MPGRRPFRFFSYSVHRTWTLGAQQDEQNRRPRLASQPLPLPVRTRDGQSLGEATPAKARAEVARAGGRLERGAIAVERLGHVHGERQTLEGRSDAGGETRRVERIAFARLGSRAEFGRGRGVDRVSHDTCARAPFK